MYIKCTPDSVNENVNCMHALCGLPTTTYFGVVVDHVNLLNMWTAAPMWNRPTDQSLQPVIGANHNRVACIGHVYYNV